MRIEYEGHVVRSEADYFVVARLKTVEPPEPGHRRRGRAVNPESIGAVRESGHTFHGSLGSALLNLSARLVRASEATDFQELRLELERIESGLLHTFKNVLTAKPAHAPVEDAEPKKSRVCLAAAE